MVHMKIMSFRRMNGKEIKSDDDLYIQMKPIFTQFITEVTNFEQLVVAGGMFLSVFQHGLERLQLHPKEETSELVASIIEENENERLKSYIEAGWVKTHSKVRHMREMNTCFEGLQDHISEVKQIMCELDRLMDNAGCALRMSLKSLSGGGNDEEDDEPTSSVGVDATEYASLMAIIYGMVKRDFEMQEKIVSSFSLMTSAEELDSYCLMWSLRPFVDDAVINQALRLVD